MAQDIGLDDQVANATLIADDLWEYTKFKRAKTIKLLLKIYGNIKQHPNEAKFRKLNMSKIASKADILSQQLRQLLLCSGFTANNDGVHYDLADRNVNLCNAVGDMIRDRVNDEEAQLEKERERIKQETKQKQQQYLNQQKEKREILKKQIKSDKRDKAAKPKMVCSSKANKLQFGRKDVKVEFKTSGGG